MGTGLIRSVLTVVVGTALAMAAMAAMGAVAPTGAMGVSAAPAGGASVAVNTEPWD